MTTFRPGQSGKASWGTSIFGESTAERYLHGDGGEAPVKVALQIYAQIIDKHGMVEGTRARGKFDENVSRAIASIREFRLLRKLRIESDNDAADQAIHAYIQQIVDRVIQPISTGSPRSGRGNEATFGNNPAILVCLAMKLADKPPHNVTREDILRAAHYEGGTIANAISEAFTRYKVEQYSWAHSEGERGRGDISSLMATYRRENPAPWGSASRHS